MVVMTTAANKTVRTDELASTAAAKMEPVIPFAEFRDELWNIKDGAPGIDGMSLLALKCVSEATLKKMLSSATEHLKMPFKQWPLDMREGWVITLHKKWARSDLNNNRGVFLLPLVSRFVARIFASRIRNWAEELDIVDEN